MSPFSVQCKSLTKELMELMNQLKDSYIKVGNHFAFDVSKYPMEECFSDISNFKFNFAKAYAEIVQSCESKKFTRNAQNSQLADNQQHEVDHGDHKQPTENVNSSLGHRECFVKLKPLTEKGIKIICKFIYFVF